MGTGVGEAMLIGAAVGATAGGAGAAIQGGDPLKGALTGGAMGAVGGGLGAGFGAAGGATAGGTSGATAGGASGGIGAGASSGIGIGAGSGASSGIGITASQVPSLTGGLTAGTTAGTAAGSSLGAGSSILANSANPALYGMASTGAATGAAGGAGVGAGTSMVSPGTMSLASSAPGNFTGFAPQLSNTGLATIGGSSALSAAMQAERDQYGMPEKEEYKSSFDPSKFTASRPTYAPGSVYVPSYKDYTTAAEGGIMKLAEGGMPEGPVERMSMNNQKFSYDPNLNPVTGMKPINMNNGGIAEILQAAKNQGLTPEAYQNIYGRGNKIIEMEKALKAGAFTAAKGGIADLGGYSDGGRMLKGPGDGMSDSIPASIGNRQPARLADGEFVVPADVVSHLGNGSTDAGAKRLYGMMDKVRKARTGKKKQAPAVKPEKYMPA